MSGPRKAVSASGPDGAQVVEPNFGYDELVSFMQKTLADQKTKGNDDIGLSTWEWAEAWNVNERTARIRLQRLFRAGRIVSGKRHGVGMDGRATLTPVYRAK